MVPAMRSARYGQAGRRCPTGIVQTSQPAITEIALLVGLPNAVWAPASVAVGSVHLRRADPRDPEHAGRRHDGGQSAGDGDDHHILLHEPDRAQLDIVLDLVKR